MNDQWFCKLSKGLRGPFSKGEILQLIQREIIHSNDEVRNGPDGVWMEAEEVFAEAFGTHYASETNRLKTIIYSHNFDHYGIRSKRKYPVLKFAIKTLYVLAVIFSFISVVLLIYGLFVMTQAFLPGLVLVLQIIVCCPIIVIALLSAAETIQLFIDMGSNLREIRDRLPER